MVAKLNKEDLARVNELTQCEKEIRTLISEAESKHMAFWEELRQKYNLSFRGRHYIKKNAIYKQEV